tara:strand:+ start:776 stop:1285 length:510 start_codon:yes stop_codon:yes gene_type:complete
MSCTNYDDYKGNISCVVDNRDTKTDIFAIERELFEKINVFNQMYSCYIRKNYNNEYITREQLNVADCSNTNISDTSINAIFDEITDLVNQIDEIIPDVPAPQFTMANIHDVNLRNSRIRKDIEVKMNELKEGKGSHAAASKLNLDSTIYASILWTTLATGFVYYVFVEL